MKSAVEPIAVMLLRRGRTLDKYALAAEAKCHQRTAQRVLRGMHQLKMVYISGWETIYRKHIPSYSIAPGKDKAKPPSITPKLSARKRRKNPEVRIQELNARRMRKIGSGLKHHPQI